MSSAQAQIDTSMSYADFLNDCRNFTRDTQDEIWVVTFWASYNSESKIYFLPAIQESIQRYRNKPVRFVNISTDTRRRSWERAIKRVNLGGENLWIPSQEDYDFLKLAFQHNRLPAAFVVEQSGQIRRVKLADLNALVDALSKDLPNRPYYNGPEFAEKEGVNKGSDDGDLFETDESGEWITYTVRKGDTLYAIQRKYDVKVAQIKRVNSLRSDNIRPGQVLKIKRR